MSANDLFEKSPATEWSDENGQKGNDGAAHPDYTLQEVVGIAVLSDWTRWVAVDSGGEVWEYSKNPTLNVGGFWRGGSCTKSSYITKVVPPFNFKNCIWEIKP